MMITLFYNFNIKKYEQIKIIRCKFKSKCHSSILLLHYRIKFYIKNKLIGYFYISFDSSVSKSNV
jgi:hypothetical protein